MRLLSSILGLCACAFAQSRDPYEGDTSGCGKSHDNLNSTFPGSVDSGGIQRNYSIHLPGNYSSNHRHPMVLGFHGSQSVGLFFEADTRFNDAADGYIAVYPDGIGGAWAGANYSEASVSQDLQFVWDLLADLRREYCVDSSRILATGMSIGGGFVDTIACNNTVGREFAAFAPVAGAFYTDNDDNYEDCKPAKPVTIMSFHGEEDEEVPYDGGEGSGGELPSIEDWMERWSDRIDCSDTSLQELPFEGGSRLYKDCGEEKGALIHIVMEDRNHSWPSNEPNFSQNLANDDLAPFDTATFILSFLGNARRRERDDDEDPPSTTSATTSSAPDSTETGGPETTESGGAEPDSTSQMTPNLWIVALAVALQIFGNV